MVNPIRSQGYRRKEDMHAEQALQEQEIIDSVTDTLESNATPIVLETQESSGRSFFSTVVSCAPYLIMGMGAYMIWTRARRLFKPAHDDKKEAQG